MGVNIDEGVAWMQARKGQVTYSMDYRNGPDSYDCSSSIYYALLSAGAVSAGWAVNTEYEHGWLEKNGYELISENQPWGAQRGDIFIWGRKGYSSGAGGHTGMFIDSDNIIHCNWAYDGISVNDHDERWLAAGRPYYYVYRLTNTGKQDAEPKRGWQKDDTGFWYVRANGTYPKGQFEYIEDNKAWFYFDDLGYMLAEKWLHHTDGNWYWFDKDGYMATSWKRIGGAWYFFNRDGSMQTGWIKYYDNWYYCDATNGDMKSSTFVPYNGGYYMLLEDGRLADKESFKVEPDGLITTKQGGQDA